MSAQTFIHMQQPYDNTTILCISLMHMQSMNCDWADLVPNVCYASTSKHLQPRAFIKHNMFQLHVYTQREF